MLLEQKLLKELEEGEFAYAFSSGMAAINTLTDALDKNFHIICSDDVYGGTRRIFDKVKNVNQSSEITYTDFSRENNWQGLNKENTNSFHFKFIFCFKLRHQKANGSSYDSELLG